MKWGDGEKKFSDLYNFLGEYLKKNISATAIFVVLGIVAALVIAVTIFR